MTGRPEAAARQRDRSERAWSERWGSHYAGLLRYASSLLAGDVHRAEDVVQEAALRLWRHPEVLDSEHLDGWLRMVARHIVVDGARSRRARPAEVTLNPGTDRAVCDHVERIVAVDAVARALATLAPWHRAVVFEIYVRDRSVADVAVDLGIPAGTVKSRCHTAVAHLRAGTAGRMGR